METQTQATIDVTQFVVELKQLRETVAALEAKIDSLLAKIQLPTAHPYIYTSLAMHNGEPTIRGTSITVRTIVERTRLGDSVAEIVDGYPVLNAAQVHDALSYYYDHTDEIEKYIRENQEALWRVMQRGSSSRSTPTQT